MDRATPTVSRATTSHSAHGSSRVCDAFDAIISDRPYSTARTPEQAVAELRRWAGVQFDPDVVDAFAAVLADRTRRPEGVAHS